VRPFPALTERETEILGHIASGRANHEIAASLFLSEKTVRNNVAMILAKLHVRDRAAAVAAARDAGLASPPR
jgi:DNA-binding NarL/FixJ family response regulator